MLRIKEYTHYFAIESPPEVYRNGIEAFAKTYLLKVNMFRLKRGNLIVRNDKMFAARSKDPLIYRFHISVLEKFLDYMSSRGLGNFNVEKQELHTPAEANFKLITDKTPFAYQEDIINYLVSPGKKKVIELQAGGGKANRNGTLVRTLNGWTPIEQLKVGDKVMGETGEFHNVTGVYPQGLKDIYRFTFRDGRTIDACKDHLWFVKYCPKGTGFHIRKEVLSTAELLEFQENIKSRLTRFYIPVIENRVYEPNVDLPIDPYLLGVLLGDANIRTSRIVIEKPLEDLHDVIDDILNKNGIVHRRVVYFKQQKKANGEIYEKKIIQTVINRNAGNIANIKFFDELDRMGLLGKLSSTKYIPDVYMTAGTEQRLELVRGLMDTDGYPRKNGGFEIGFVSEKLSVQTRELLFSLGCSVKMYMKIPKFTYRGERRIGQEYYRMSVRSRNTSELFKIPSKRNRARTGTQYSRDFHLRIERIEKLPEQDYATCISVDNPTRLYIAENYIVTHNTLCTLFALSQIKQRTLLVIKPMYIKRWLDDVASKNGIINLSPKELVVVRGSEALASVIKMGLDGTLNYKMIIVSNKTMQLYFKDYLSGTNMEKYMGVKPQELFDVLKIGVRIIDEAHQDFHQCFMTDLFTNCPKTIELSATLIPDDPFLKSMYELVYPKQDRFGGGVLAKYVDVYSVPYRMDHSNNQNVRVSNRGMTSYSHGSFEESIMKNKKRLENYISMVVDLTENHFIKKRYSDYKLLIFAGRVELCKILADRLSEIYPKLKIGKYTQEEDYSVLAELDIIVSTPMSSGTAVDIPRLQVCINTVAIGSTQANLQMIGRLRQLRDVPVNPTFLYLYCVDIPKHMEYHIKKRDHTFKGRTLDYIDLMPIKYMV